MPISIDSVRSATHLALRLRLSEEAAPAERPLHIGILLDNSGSMEGSRLTAVKRTLAATRSLLRIGDCLSLVTFNNRANVCLLEHEITDNETTEAVFAAIDTIQTGGHTNLSAGLETLFEITSRYDAVILLTDGIINAGITSSVGLRTIALAPALTFHTLGYGAEHNRGLLRELAVASRGTYTYVDSDEILPIAMGDILSGLRAEAVRNVRVSIRDNCWRCMEVGSGETQTTYTVGNMVPGRDYWIVYEATDSDMDPVVSLCYDGCCTHDVDVPLASELPPIVLTEQILRARVAYALNLASILMEVGGDTDGPLSIMRGLQSEIAALPEPNRMRPLILRLTAQLAEVVDGIERTTTHYPTHHIMARLSSGAAYLSTQRGVYRSADDDAANTSFFSSPAQRDASQTVYSVYNPTAPATVSSDEPTEPTPCASLMGEID